MTTSFDFERRQFIRLPLAVPIRYKFLSREMASKDMEVVYEGMSQNIGAGGLLLRGKLPDAAWLSKLLTRKMYIGINIMLPNVERPVTCVTDCGCFGDAMKGSVGRSLTPWESFTKDAILFVFILPLFITAWWREGGIPWNRTADDLLLLPFGLAMVGIWSWIFTWWGPVWFTLIGIAGYWLVKRLAKGTIAEWATAGWAALITLVFTWWCTAHLPVRDYRPYAPGKSIAEQ